MALIWNSKCMLLIFYLIKLTSEQSKSDLSEQSANQHSDYFNLVKKKFSPLPSCKWDHKYDVGRSIVAGLCFLFASFILLFGYRRRRISFCIIGFSTFSILTYLIIIVEAKFNLLINICISMATGIFASLFTTSNLYCGYFLTGLLAGFVIGFIFLLIYTLFTVLNTIALPCVIIAVFGLFQTFITMWWRHRMLIFSITLVGSAAMTAALDHFVEDLFLLDYIEMKLFYNREAEMCWWSYVVIGTWPSLFVFGMLIQCLFTGKERQKEAYMFVYKRNTTTRHIQDDQNHLIRYGSDSY